MSTKTLVLGLIILLAATASADEYLKPTCQSILKGDLINGMQVVDLDKDGTPNIMFGTSTGGVLHNYIYKGADCTTDWTALISGGWNYDTDGDVRSFKVVDLLGNGKNEVVINSVKSAAGGSQPPGTYIRAISANAIDFWNFRDACGFSQAVDAADIDGTGKPNVVFGALSSNICALKDSGDGLMPKGSLLWSYQAKNPVGYVKALDIDGDGKIETVALANKYMEAYLIVLSSGGTLKWEKKIDGGIFTAMVPENVVSVSDINGDGKAETIVGTYKNNVIAFDSAGNELWRYDTKNLVSSIHVADINGKRTVLAGSAPKVYALDGSGSLVWTWEALTKSTVYSMSSAELDGGTSIAVGSTKYLYVLDGNGKLKGTWKYTVEIQGLNKAYEERDANAVAVYMGDLDGDGETEVVAGWNWEQSTVRGNQYSADLRVYEINEDYVPSEATATTLAQSGGTQVAEDTANEEVTPQDETAEQADEGTLPEAAAENKSPCSCIPMLPAILALAVAIVAKIPLAATDEKG
ncbi:MAG: hypothetical protein V1875_06465 [Candidatus Altiarchaeota archaeon]